MLKSGGTLSILGESGSGKTMTMRALMRLLPPNAELSGQVISKTPTSSRSKSSGCVQSAVQRLR